MKNLNLLLSMLATITPARRTQEFVSTRDYEQHTPQLGKYRAPQEGHAIGWVNRVEKRRKQSKAARIARRINR